MSEPDFTRPLARRRIAIVGIGLIGGSLAYELKDKCEHLFGVDPDPNVVARARSLNLFDRLATKPQPLLQQADLVILSAPVRRVLDLLAELPGLHPGSPLVMDTGSTKLSITAAMRTLPDRFYPLGGHPMAGKEVGGLENAGPDLFRDAPFTLVRVRHEAHPMDQLAEALLRAIGAHPIWLEAADHDRIAADVSHLPYLLAAGLAHSTPVEDGLLIGSGFRSAARLAATPPAMMMDVITTNRANILQSLRRFTQTLTAIESILREEQDEALQDWLAEARARHRSILESGD
ncbi:MAG: prephenate dehydrogenase [Anaerolineales bacterium]|nr:prephenate dehydrogenase [Anaerolineales bacterium]